MIPNIRTGSSFRGAQLYYLHDKRKQGELLRLSDERVAWTVTRNTAHDAADDAFAEMIATARDQDHLKLMSGVRLSGRCCEEPVMTISLSWHPSEKLSQEQMERAADSYLRHMDWDAHQAVYACHTDRPHQHLHIVLNRIHPETGRVLDDSFSKNRSQEWARAHEQEYGRIWCEERIGKDYSRADGKEPRSMPHDFAIDAREAQQHYAELEEAARTLDQREKAELAQHHQDEREAFFDSRHSQFRQARETAFREVRDEYKQHWVEHFRRANAARRQVEGRSATQPANANRQLHCHTRTQSCLPGSRSASASKSHPAYAANSAPPGRRTTASGARSIVRSDQRDTRFGVSPLRLHARAMPIAPVLRSAASSAHVRPRCGRLP